MAAASISLRSAGPDVVVFPDQISRVVPIPEVPGQLYRSYVKLSSGRLYTLYNTAEELLSATGSLLISLDIISFDGTLLNNPPQREYFARRIINSFSPTTSTYPLFGRPGFNTVVNIMDEGNTQYPNGNIFISETVEEVRARYNGTISADEGYVRSVRICDGEPMTGDITIPCHVTGITIGNEDETIYRGIVNIPQPTIGVTSIALGGGPAEDGQVTIPVGSTSLPATMISGSELLEIRNFIDNLTDIGASALIGQTAYGVEENWSLTQLSPYNNTALNTVVFVRTGTQVATKTIGLSQLISPGVYKSGAPTSFEVHFSNAVTSLTLNDTMGYAMVNGDNIGTTVPSVAESIVLTNVRSFSAKVVPTVGLDTAIRYQWLVKKIA